MLKTPEQWSLELKVRVLDPDGWKRDGKSFQEPISLTEFERRLIYSTCSYLPGFNFRKFSYDD